MVKLSNKYSTSAIYNHVKLKNKGFLSTDLVISNLQVNQDIIFNNTKLILDTKSASSKGINIKYNTLDPDNDIYNFAFEGLIPFTKSISSAYKHTLLVTNTCGVLSCGKNFDGKLGNGSNNDIYVANPQYIKSTGIRDYLGNLDNNSYNGRNCISVSSGLQHSAILLNNGKVLTFGQNKRSQLGHGNSKDYDSGDPSGIKHENLKNYLGNSDSDSYDGYNAISISCGQRHNLVLLNNGKVLSFGRNDYGQLGHGTVIDYSSGDPSGVKDENLKDANNIIDNKSYNSTNAIQISTEYNHSAILLKSGKVITFGDNTNGQLGHGKIGYRTGDPSGVIDGSGYDGTNAVSVSCGSFHTAILLNTGKVLTFGAAGSLGHGPGKSGYSSGDPSGVFDASGYNGTNAVKVSCGTNHTAILLDTGKVITFGKNEYGQLGHGTVEDYCSTDPSGVIDASGYNGSNAVDVECGSFNTFILLKNGNVVSFGRSTDRQLGLGNDYSYSSGDPSGINTTDFSNNCMTVSKYTINTNFNLDKKFLYGITSDFSQKEVSKQLYNYKRRLIFDNSNISVHATLPMNNSYFKLIGKSK